MSGKHLDDTFELSGVPDTGDEYFKYTETDWRIQETIDAIERKLLEEHPEWADDPYGRAFLAGDNERRDEGS